MDHGRRCMSRRFELPPSRLASFISSITSTRPRWSKKKKRKNSIPQISLNTSDWHKQPPLLMVWNIFNFKWLPHAWPASLILDGYHGQVQPRLPHFLRSQTRQDKQRTARLGLARLVMLIWKCLAEEELLWGCSTARSLFWSHKLLSYTPKSRDRYRITNAGGDSARPGSLNHNTDGGRRDRVWSQSDTRAASLIDSTPASQDITGRSGWWWD